MRKVNKNITRIVAILLALVMISACVLSSTFAKYVTKKDATATVGFTKFGVTITPGSDLSSSYDTTAEEGVVEVRVNTSSASTEPLLIAPGTRGALACFEVTSADVPWYIDINGSITIGDGYKASSELILNENGDPIDYFPILISIYRCNWDGSKYVAPRADSVVAHSVVRLTPDASKGTVVGSAEERYKLSFTADPSNDIDSLESAISTSINTVFDDMGTNNTGNAAGTKSMFIVEWYWPYDNTSERIAGMESSKMVEQRGNGSLVTYNYQTRELDTQLAEAMKKEPNAFNIKLELKAKVSQANGVKS